MFKCLECGSVFEIPKDWKETHGLDSPPYEWFTGCPKCLGAYEEAFECEECGEYFTARELEDGLCEKCREEVEE